MINDRQITITVGVSRKSTQWLPQRLLLSELYAKLQTPARGTETLAEYLAMTKGQQDDLKDVGGFVAGTLNGKRRKAGNVTGRDVLTLDLDNVPAGGTADVLCRLDGLTCGYCVYSTRKHMAAAPRLRVLLPLDRTCAADEYEPCIRRMAEMIGMNLADPTTFEANLLSCFGSSSMKNKVVFKQKSEFAKWVTISNLYAKSLLSPKVALRQFNALTPAQRKEIANAFAEYDNIRRKKIPKGETDSAWEISAMVDAHIIATEFDIDPLTAVMCRKPLCKANESIFVR